jgi:hypothetical protein
MMATVLICGWVVLAKILQSIPSKDNHWRRAYVLIAVGIPTLGMATYSGGVWAAVLGLGVGIAVLHWPLYRSVGWLKEKEL